MVNATHRPLFPGKRTSTHFTGDWVGLRVGLDGGGKSGLTGIRSPDRPARSKLYQCHCVEWASSKNKRKCRNYVLWQKETQL